MAYEEGIRYIERDKLREPKDLRDQLIEALKSLGGYHYYESNQWRRIGDTLDLVHFDSEGNPDYREISIDSLNEKISDALETVVTWGPILAEKLERDEEEGWPFSDEQVEAAALEKFCLEHPLGRREAKAKWDEFYPDILHVEVVGPYSTGSRFKEAQIMLEAAGGRYVETE